MTRKGKHAKRFSCWSSQKAGVSLYRLDVPLVCHNPGPTCRGRDNHFLGLIDSGRLIDGRKDCGGLDEKPDKVVY